MKLLLKNGSLLDKSENLLFTKKDVLIDNGQIIKISGNIFCLDAEIIDCENKIVSAGFIDSHVHCYKGAPGLGVMPDDVGVKQGVTSIIDAGTAGPENLEDFIEKMVNPAKTRVFCNMNYSKKGLWDKPEGNDESKWDIDLAEKIYQQHKDIIVGIKARASNSCVGELGILPIKAAKELATRCNIPLYVHIGHALPLIEDTLNVMQQGDIITHSFHGKDNNVLTDDGQLKPATAAAIKRGVKFDVGHGRESFAYRTLEKAIKIGFYPDCISTDLHEKSLNHPVASLSEVMDRMMALGIRLEDVVADVTSQPAKLFNLTKLGKLKEGYLADFTIFHIVDCNKFLLDSEGDSRLVCKTIVIDKAIVNGKVEMSN